MDQITVMSQIEIDLSLYIKILRASFRYSSISMSAFVIILLSCPSMPVGLEYTYPKGLMLASSTRVGEVPTIASMEHNRYKR